MAALDLSYSAELKLLEWIHYSNVLDFHTLCQFRESFSQYAAQLTSAGLTRTPVFDRIRQVLTDIDLRMPSARMIAEREVQRRNAEAVKSAWATPLPKVRRVPNSERAAREAEYELNRLDPFRRT